MNLLEWLEATGLAQWVTIIGYPWMLTLHAIGMAMVVGILTVVSLRLLGFFRPLSYTLLERLLWLAWIGFAVNLLSGVCIFISQATFYAASAPFLIKMALVSLGVLTAGLMQKALRSSSAERLREGAPAIIRALAICSLALWLGAITAGRLIAYI